jgi:plasmid maintenance system antidote protein VapI
MEMKRVSAGELRAIGYDDAQRILRVEVGSRLIEYTGVSAEVWRRLSTSSSMWSYYRDNIEENYPERIVR